MLEMGISQDVAEDYIGLGLDFGQFWYLLFENNLRWGTILDSAAFLL